MGVIRREDKFGSIGDVSGSSHCLLIKNIPQNCVNAIREGAKDAKSQGLGAWVRHDRFLYIGLVIAIIILITAIVKKCFGRKRLENIGEARFGGMVHNPSLSYNMSDFILVPRVKNGIM